MCKTVYAIISYRSTTNNWLKKCSNQKRTDWYKDTRIKAREILFFNMITIAERGHLLYTVDDAINWILTAN